MISTSSTIPDLRFLFLDDNVVDGVWSCFRLLAFFRNNTKAFQKQHERAIFSLTRRPFGTELAPTAFRET